MSIKNTTASPSLADRLKIIKEQLDAIRASGRESDDLRSIVRDVRSVTESIWYDQGWNSSSIDC